MAANPGRTDEIIDTAARLLQRSPAGHSTNGEELIYAWSGRYLASFTKGLPHDYNTGLLKKPENFQQLVTAIDSGNGDDFRSTPMGPEGNRISPSWKAAVHAGRRVKDWDYGETRLAEKPKSALANTGQLAELAANPARHKLPPPPRLGSPELIAEMAELYSQAKLRDIPFTAFMDSGIAAQVEANPAEHQKVQAEIVRLNQLEWFGSRYGFNTKSTGKADSTDEAHRRRGPLNAQSVFRGVSPGDWQGPYISQFLLAGTRGVDSCSHEATDGFIQFGSLRIDQRVRYAIRGHDYLTDWDTWFDAQNGVEVDQEGMYEQEPSYRFLATPRDLATHVHNDTFYEAYLNANLILLANELPLDPSLQGKRRISATRIIALLSQAANRALKAARYHKFHIHRRPRPEATAGLMEKYSEIYPAIQPLSRMIGALCDSGHFGDWGNPIGANGQEAENRLLPLAFPEGAPMSPAYGSAHATVAGACVTVLKALFDHTAPLNIAGYNPNKALVASEDGGKLNILTLPKPLTVGDELDKLASNVALGRCWAGVNYYSDYLESMRMGQAIALELLTEQKRDRLADTPLSVSLFEGGVEII